MLLLRTRSNDEYYTFFPFTAQLGASVCESAEYAEMIAWHWCGTCHMALLLLALVLMMSWDH